MNEKIQEQREELRKEALEQRRLMPKPYLLHKSALICQRLLQSFDLTLGITGKTASDCVVAVYSAFPEEVQLDDFILGVYERGARVAFPCMIDDARSIDKRGCSQTMEMREVTEADYLAKSVYFLQHPLKTYSHDSKEIEAYPYIRADQLTMMVVPVVAFDKNHNRLGYGKGNYDRYLSQFLDASQKASLYSVYSPSNNTDSSVPLNVAGVLTCRIVGVAFEEQGVPLIPTQDHDIALPIIAL